MDEKHAEYLNPLVLSYVGDAVLTLYTRERLACSSDLKAGGLHKIATKYVCAYGQAMQLDAIFDLLDSQELDIARRARNTHNTTKAKNADLDTYKKATAFEAVIGFLHLVGKEERKLMLIEKGFATIK